MPLLVKPYLGCNLNCRYCYEREYRKRKKPSSQKPKTEYNLEAVFKKMEELKDSQGCQEMVLHGGEPLVMGKDDVRKLLKRMKELTGRSGIQTNGFLIDDDYIQIFKECNTSVGLSYDGPGELSKFRPGTANLNKKIEKMVKEGLNVSLIMVVSKANAGTNRLLKKLKDYLLVLNKLKVGGRLNPCGGAPEFELEEKRLIEVYLDLADFCLHHNLCWSPFKDILNGLQGKSRVCTFSGCDRFHTHSATVIVGDGSVTNCMRTNEKEIILRHPAKHDTRNEILSEIPQEFGGCRECQYWHACYGGCPTQAIDNDWRNKTYFCPLYRALFKFYEKILGFVGISSVPLREKCEERTKSLELEAKNQDPSHGDAAHQDSHGDWPNHKDGGHGDWSNHGDSPHGDSI